MPIVVNPSFVWPPEVDPVVSPDGRITAIVDPAHAGVLLRANFDDSVPDQEAQPEKVLRRNLVTNPSFEAGLEGVETTSTVVLDRAQGTYFVDSGEYSLRVQIPEGGSAATGIVTQPLAFSSALLGKWVAFSAAIRRGNTGVRGPSHARVRIEARSGSSAIVSSPAEYSQLENTYLRFTTAIQIPAEGINNIIVRIWYQGSAGYTAPQAGDSYTDAWVACTGSTESEARAATATYFDGSTSTVEPKRYRWTGPVNASASEEYTPATPFIPGHGVTVARVRFERQDGTLVRSGNPAWAPGGYAHAYDHEATLGGGTLWRAVPILFDGTEGTPSEYVGAVIPALSDGWAWLKPVADPNKAMLLKVEPPDLSYDGRVDTTSIAGSARPAATWDVLEGFTTQLRSLVREKPVADQLMTLLNEGPVLAQFPACAGLPDFYFIRGKVDVEHVYWRDYPARRYQWEVISIDRPDTTDSPLRIPDLSYNTVERDWTTYDQLKSTVVSYNKLLEP